MIKAIIFDFDGPIVTRNHKEIYKKHEAIHLNVKSEEAIFIDDKERNTKAAEALGIKSIIFKNFDQFKKDLEKLILMTLSNIFKE